MPKKKPPANAFYFYMQHFKSDQDRRGNRIPWERISEAASPSWQRMNKEDREPFEKKAKDAKQMSKTNPRIHERYTSQGLSYSEIDREKEEAEKKEKNMKKRIKDLVDEAFMSNGINEQPFYFMSGNFFCVTNCGVYVPAEVALTKLTFLNGIVSRYHTYLNPGVLPLGSAFEAKDHSEKTHRLPPPPKAMGETKLYKVRSDIVQFITPNNGFNKTDATKNSLVVFTKKENIAMLESFLDQFYDEYSKVIIEIFPLHELFFVLKQQAESMGVTGEIKIKNIYISDILLEQDHFENLDGLACTWHDEQDASKFCALSQVVRWSYIFADHICSDLGIQVVPGIHLPKNADVDIILPSTSGNKPLYEVEPEVNGDEKVPQAQAAQPPAPTGLAGWREAARAASEYTTENNLEENDSDGGTWIPAHNRRQRVREPAQGSFDSVPYRRAAGRGQVGMDSRNGQISGVRHNGGGGRR